MFSVKAKVFLGSFIMIFSLVFCPIAFAGTVGLSGSNDLPGGRLICSGDMNSDGRNDLIRITGNRTSEVLSVALAKTDGWQLLAGLAIPRDVHDLKIADMNNDGHLDAVVAFVGETSSISGIQVFLNDGQGRLSPKIILDGIGYHRLACADFDGDGKMDVAGATYPSTNVKVALGNGDGSFTGTIDVMGQNGQGGLIAADLNGDGAPDLIAADNTSIAGSPGYYADKIRVVLNINDGTGAFSPYTTYTVDSTPSLPVAGDFNGDGTIDIAVTANNQTYLLTNDGSGNLNTPLSLLSYYATPSGLTAEDLNSDGKLDLIGTTINDLYYLQGDGNGSFAAPLWFSSNLIFSSTNPAIADFNNDGLVDIATGQNTTTRIWTGSTTNDYSFNVQPLTATVNLDIDKRFDFQVLNAAAATTNHFSWSADAGSFGPPGDSWANLYTAPDTLPTGGTATITATRDVSTPEIVNASVTFSDYKLVQGLGLNMVQDFVFNPADPLTIYIATDNGVQLSSDSGRTSISLGNGLNHEVRSLAITETSGAPILLAATMYGVYRYELNAGLFATWSLVSNATLPSSTLILAASGSTVYAGRWFSPTASNSVYKSVDGGITWTELSFISRDIGHIWLIDNNHLYVSHRNGLAYSANGGSSWEERGVELAAHYMNDSEVVGGLVFDPAHPEIMLAGLKESMISGNALFRTSDGGVTWKPIWSLSVSKVLALVADPINADNLYLLADTGLWKSNDHGTNWWKIDRGLPDILTYTLKIAPDNGSFIYCGRFSGLYVSGFRDGYGPEAPGIATDESLVNLKLGATHTFQATATGLPDTTVIWSIVSGGGTIDTASGFYTAPTLMPTSGRALLQATAIADSHRYGLVEVKFVPTADTAALDPPIEIPGGRLLCSGDMNNDGRNDLVRITGSCVSEVLSVAIAEADDWQQLSDLAIPRDVYDLKLSDMNNDGYLDAVVAFIGETSSVSGIQVFLNDGQGRLSAQTKFAGTGYFRLTCADFNSDGKMDVAGATYPAANVNVIYGDGAGYFTNITNITGNNGRGGIVAADFNGDGRPDLIAADNTQIHSDTSTYYAQEIRLALNAGNGAWSPAIDYAVDNCPKSPIAGDFNNDGAADVAVTAGGKLFLLLNDGSGNLLPPTQILTFNSTPGCIAAAHLNCDAELDLVGITSTDLFLLPADGNGGFETPIWFSNGLSFHNLVITDLNNDGRIDIATSHGELTRIWPGTAAGAYSFTVQPPTATINLDTDKRFEYLILNAAQATSNQISWSSDSGHFGIPHSSSANLYTAPQTMPAGNTATITATRTLNGSETATAATTFTDYTFSQALALNNTKVQAIVFDPDNSQILYAATSSGVWQSTDGGRTSVRLGTNLTQEVSALVLTVTAGQRSLLAYKKYGLYRYDVSQGISGTWVSSAGGVLPYLPLTLAATGSTVYAAGWSNNEQNDILYKSEDGGINWGPTTFKAIDIGKIWLIDNNHLYVSHRDGLAYSADGGSTWEERGIELAAHDMNDSVVVGGLVFDLEHPEMMLAGLKEPMIRGNALFRTADGGVTWKPAGYLAINKVFDLTADPTNADTLYLLADTGLWKSINRGDRWWKIGRNLPLLSTTYYTVKTSPFAPQAVFTGLSSGIYASQFIALPPTATLEVGPSGYAFNSIQNAIAVAAAGDTVLVHAGTYQENIIIDAVDLTIKAASGPIVTTIDGNGTGPAISFTNCSDSSVLEGFTLTNGTAVSASEGGGIYCYQSDPLIKECKIVNNNSPHSGAGVYLDESAPTIINCRIDGNQAAESGGGIYAANGSTLTLINTVVSNNLAAGNVDPAAITFVASSGNLTHCTIADNSNGISLDASSGLNIVNSIAWGNSNPLIADPAATVTISSSNIENGYSGPDNFALDPLFTADGSYHLTINSPCIEAGNSSLLPTDEFDLDEDNDLTEALSLDFDGDNRIRGSAPDIGADEYCPHGLFARYDNMVKLSERIIYHGYNGNCSSSNYNLYQGECTPIDNSPVNWSSGDFSVNWSGYLYSPVDGTYTLSSHYGVDGIIFIKVGDTIVADLNSNGSGYSGPVYLAADSYTPITIAFAANGGSNSMILGWIMPDLNWQLIPERYLFPEIFDFDHDFDVDGSDLTQTDRILNFGLADFAEKFGLSNHK